jgi:hypothetical protein
LEGVAALFGGDFETGLRLEAARGTQTTTLVFLHDINIKIFVVSGLLQTGDRIHDPAMFSMVNDTKCRVRDV